MASPFECEVRYRIPDMKVFEHVLSEAGARLVYTYAFTDHYFRPSSRDWDPRRRSLRFREWRDGRHPTAILFTRIALDKQGDLIFKRSLDPEGKLTLLEAPLDRCRSLLADLGFEPWLTLVKDQASFWQLPGFITVTEHVEGLGWTGELEFEGTDPEQARRNIEAALRVLQVPRRLVTPRPLSVIYAERHGLL